MKRSLPFKDLLHRNPQFRVPVSRWTGHFRSFAELADNDVEVDFGDYEIILPPENSPEGVQHIKIREVPSYIPFPTYARPNPVFSGGSPSTGKKSQFILGSEEERKMRKACNLAKRTLDYAGSLVKVCAMANAVIHLFTTTLQVGETTSRIDSLVHDFIIAHGAYPSPLRYHGFPKSICTSVRMRGYLQKYYELNYRNRPTILYPMEYPMS
jgi:methionyl aminopeptidase